MALIPGTLPNDTCYGTPQDLLELFAQYLDIPAFALNSKVVFGTSSVGLTADVVWFDTTTATNPIMKITVSGGFTDYIKNYVTNAPVVTIVGADSVLILDASDSGNTKRGLVSDIAALAVPAAGSITPAQLAQPLTRGTSTPASSATVDFTGIPSWAKRITIILEEVDSVGSGDILLQLGDSGGVENTGYVSGSVRIIGGGGSDSSNSVAGFIYKSGGQAISAIFTIVNISGNTWIAAQSGRGTFGSPNVQSIHGGGSKILSGVLDRVRLALTASDTFSSGNVNILYEG